VTANGSGDQFTFNTAGTYTVMACVPFTGSGDYRVIFNASPVSGSTVGGSGAPVCETVVVTADGGEVMGIQNPGSLVETVSGSSDRMLVIQRIS
jgi:hypothetical protein